MDGVEDCFVDSSLFFIAFFAVFFFREMGGDRIDDGEAFSIINDGFCRIGRVNGFPKEDLFFECFLVCFVVVGLVFSDCLEVFSCVGGGDEFFECRRCCFEEFLLIILCNEVHVCCEEDGGKCFFDHCLG